MGSRGENVLDTGAPFYDTYLTKDGKYISVGAIETQFYRNFIQGKQLFCFDNEKKKAVKEFIKPFYLSLGLNLDELLNSQYDFEKWTSMKQSIENIVKTKTQAEWMEIFSKKDSCVTPVLELNEAPHYQHNVDNNSFMKNDDGNFEPCPAPKLSRTPGLNYWRPDPNIGEHTVEMLRESGFDLSEINELLRNNDIEQYQPKSSL